MSDFSFSKEYRLLNKFQYQKVFDAVNSRAGVKLGNPYFRIFGCINEVEHARIGLIISKKNVKKSVERNRIKRIIRESFRLNKHQLLGDIIVLVYNKANDAENQTLRENLDNLWKRFQRKHAQLEAVQEGV